MAMINRNKLLLIVKKLGRECEDQRFYKKVYNAIMSMPTHEHQTSWEIIADGNSVQCAKCRSIYGRNTAVVSLAFKHCPNCGRKVVHHNECSL